METKGTFSSTMLRMKSCYNLESSENYFAQRRKTSTKIKTFIEKPPIQSMAGGYKIPKVTVPQNDQNNFEEINSTQSNENNPKKQEHLLTRSHSSNVLVIPTHSFVGGK